MTRPRARTLAMLAVAVSVAHLWVLGVQNAAPQASPKPVPVALRWLDAGLSAATDLPPVASRPVEPVRERAAPPPPAPAPAPAAVSPMPPPPARPPTAAARPPAAPAGAAAVAPSPGLGRDEPPPTRLAPPARLRFAVRRGASGGEAELDWRPDGAAYAATLRLVLDGRMLVEQTSVGALDAGGLSPRRFVGRWAKRSAAVNFAAERGRVSFSGPDVELPLPPGAQDRLSWLLQLAARVDAAPDAAAAGIVLPVFGPRGDGGPWRFEPVAPGQEEGQPVAAAPPEAGAAPGRDAPATAGLLHLRRAAAGPYDGAIEVWLDPARHHLPARVVLHGGADGRPPIELRRTGFE